MAALTGSGKPVWHFVELGWPWIEDPATDGGRILPTEIRSAIWHSLIAGCKGIIYFDHKLGPRMPGSTTVGGGLRSQARRGLPGQRPGQRTFAPALDSPLVTTGLG
jgi:hypothetical protein